MDRNDILQQVTNVFKEILDREDVALTDATTAQDVDGWDSLTHIQLVVAIEKHFKIRFKSKEIQSWGNVGAMIDAVQEKLM